MTLTRTEDKTDKAIARLLLQNPMGLTIGDITAEAKCTPQTARKSLARIGAEKDASGMLYVLKDEDEQDPEPHVDDTNVVEIDPAPAAEPCPDHTGPCIRPAPPAEVTLPPALTELQQRILSLLGQHRGLTAMRIAEDLHAPLEGVQNALQDLSHLVTSRPLALPEIRVWEVV